MFIENAKTLSQEDFRDPELYQEIMKLDNAVEQVAAIDKARCRAKELSIIKLFDAMLAATRKEFNKFAKNEITELAAEGANETDFSDRDALGQFRCGDWSANDSGVWVHTDKMLQYACRHPIYLNRILQNAETGQFKAEIVFIVRGKRRTICVPREMISTAQKIVKLADEGVQVNGINAPYLVKFLADLESLNPDMIREYVSTSRLGWISLTDKDGKKTKQFLPYQSEVTFDAEQSARALYDSVTESGDPDKWYACVKGLRKKREPEILVNMAASFASVLVDPCGALPFIVSLWGETGIGKSVILKLCTSIWADPSEGKYITDPKATYTALEIRLNILNSLPMMLDDMAQVSTQFDGDFSELIYRWCAGKGKDRSNKELGLNKLTSWRNCTITNGERSLVDESTQGGAINRVIDIEASGKKLFDGKSGQKTVTTIENNYGFAGREFIDRLSQLSPDEIQALYIEYYTLVKTTADSMGAEKEEKQIVPMALILMADYLSEKWLFDDGVLLDPVQCVGYLRNKGDTSEGTRAYEYLIDYIAANAHRFETDDDSEDGPRIEKWGFWKDENTVVINGTIFDRIIKDSGFQPKAFLSWAKKNGVIEPDSRGSLKKVVSQNGSKFRGVVMKVDFGEDGETAENDEIAASLPFV